MAMVTGPTSRPVLMGNAVRFLDQSLNSGNSRRARGVFALIILAASSIVLGQVLSLGGPVVETLLAAILIAQKSLVQHVSAVATALESSLKTARDAVAMIVSRDTREMTESQIARSAIESAAENLSDGVVAPVFWFLIGGLPGLVLYKAVNTADSMIGYRNDRYLEFGWASARFDDLLNLIPARFTGFLIAILSGQLLVMGGTSPRMPACTNLRMPAGPKLQWPEH